MFGSFYGGIENKPPMQSVTEMEIELCYDLVNL